jgi:hypothetical protein
VLADLRDRWLGSAVAPSPPENPGRHHSFWHFVIFSSCFHRNDRFLADQRAGPLRGKKKEKKKRINMMSF